MTEKQPVSLIVSDIDNTIADKFNGWGKALDTALNALAGLHGRDRKELEQDILACSKGKELYVGRDIRRDIRNTPSLHSSDPKEEARLEKEHEKIAHEWDKVKHYTKPYEGVLATIQKARTAGTKVVLYTDSRATPALARLMRMDITPNMVDRIYAQPDDKGTTVPFLTSAAKLFLGKKLTCLPPDTSKPNPENMLRILYDMGIKDPKRAVMVGDNINADGAGAIACGMNYAWQKAGTMLCPEAQRCYDIFFKDAPYRLSCQDHLNSITDKNRPTHILEGGFKDLNKYFSFKPVDRKQSKILNSWLAKQSDRR